MNITDKEREAICRMIGDVCRAARQVQVECNHQPENYGGQNVTAIDRAMRKERQAIRALLKTIGLRSPSKTELASCQNAYEHKDIANKSSMPAVGA